LQDGTITKILLPAIYWVILYVAKDDSKLRFRFLVLMTNVKFKTFTNHV